MDKTEGKFPDTRCPQKGQLRLSAGLSQNGYGKCI